MYQNDGVVKLTDYYYSLLLHSITKELEPEGKNNPSYFWVAPEYFSGDEEQDSRADIWSVGCLAYELASGNPPFFIETKGNVAELKRLHKMKGKRDLN